MNDKRVYWGDKYITLIQDPVAASPFKLGIPNEHGFGCYYNNSYLFVKKFAHYKDEKYPDFGCSFEAYSCDFMMEIESLSPLKVLQPEECVIHEETWCLFNNINAPENEGDLDDILIKCKS